jgi:preprotein translocase subunit SecG
MEGMAGWMKWAIALVAGFAVIVLGFKYAEIVLKIFFVANCLVLIFVVLLQSGKAADLAGAFGGAGSQTAFGPRGAANILSKATTWCAVMFMVCAMALVLRTDKAAGSGSFLEKFGKTTAPVTAPAAPGKTVVPPVSAPVSAPPATQPTPTPAPNAPAKKP